MSIFEFTDYRSYLRYSISLLPNKGRGELSKISHHLHVHTTLISQILSGSRDFTPDQAYSLSLYLGHTEFETEFFSLLTQIERAGTIDLKKHLQKKLSAIKTEALKLSKRIKYEKKLTDQQRSVFYSSWIYSAVHLFTSTRENGVTIEEISSRFGLNKQKVKEIIQFLLESALCSEISGRFKMGVQSTFIERGSADLLKHHSNWRIRAIEKSESLSEHEIMYSGQFSLSRTDFAKLRERIIEFLKESNQTVKDSPAEDVAALNIDWFWLEK